MDERIRTMIRTQRLCVLATSFRGQPYCSLMGYLWDDERGEFYLVTRQDSRKFYNLSRNPRVSLLLDTRGPVHEQEREPIRALTILGKAGVPPQEDMCKEMRERILELHPKLADLIRDPQAVLVRIRPSSFLLLEGVQDAYFEQWVESDQS